MGMEGSITKVCVVRTATEGQTCNDCAVKYIYIRNKGGTVLLRGQGERELSRRTEKEGGKNPAKKNPAGIGIERQERFL